jgi:WD40 repeat protein
LRIKDKYNSKSNSSNRERERIVERTHIESSDDIIVSVSKKLSSVDWKNKDILLFRPGEKIDDKYVVTASFSGAFGNVYATEPNSGILFAIKQPIKEILQLPGMPEIIYKEADHWNDLGMHPNITYCYFVKLIDNVPYIFMEFVGGGTLRDWIWEGKCKDIRLSLDIAIQVCHGMEHAHRKGLLHRDLKPENILMTREGIPKITDFGLSGPPGVTRREMGSINYMAPEQLNPPFDIGTDSDIFSFGVCLWEMFCNQERPYLVKARRHISRIRNPRDLNTEISARLEDILFKCVELDRKKRYKNFEALRKALNQEYKELYNEDSPFFKVNIPDSVANDLNNRGFSFYQIGEEAKARESWEEALKSDPKHLEATFNLGCLKWKNAEDNWSNLLTKLDRTENRSPTYWLCKGWIHFMEGNNEEVQKIQDSENRLTNPLFLGALFNDKRPYSKCIQNIKCRSKINSICFSPSNELIAAGSWDDKVHLWDVKSGKKINEFIGHKDAVISISFSLNNKFIYSSSQDHTIRIWNIKSGRDVKVLYGKTFAFNSVCFSPENNLIITGCSDGMVRIWQMSNLVEINEFNGKIDKVCSISPDGRLMLSVKNENNVIFIWDLVTGKVIKEFTGQSGSFSSICFSSDARTFISSNYRPIFLLWDIISGIVQKKFVPHSGPVNVEAIIFSPDDKFILSSLNNGMLHLWEVDSGRQIRALDSHGYNTICFSTNGSLIASGNTDGIIRIWEFFYPKLDSFLKVFFPMISQPRTTIEVSRNSLLARSLINMVNSDLSSGEVKKVYLTIKRIQKIPGYKRASEVLYLLANIGRKGIKRKLNDSWEKLPMDFELYEFKRILYLNGSLVISGCDQKNIRFWDVSSGEVIGNFEKKKGDKDLVIFCNNNKSILFRGEDNEIRQLDIASGKEIRRIKFFPLRIDSTKISPDGRFLFVRPIVFGKKNDIIQLWDLDKGIKINEFHGYSAESIMISPDSKYFIYKEFDRRIKLQETISGKVIRTYYGHTKMIRSVNFSPDSKYVLSGSDDTSIRLWNIKSDDSVRTFRGHIKPVVKVWFSPDGRYIFSDSEDLTIRIWNLENGREIKKLKEVKANTISFSQDSKIFTAGHWMNIRLRSFPLCRTVKRVFIGWDLAYIDTLNFSPDNRYLITTSHDDIIRIWDILSRKQIKCFEQQYYHITSVHFSPDFRFIIALHINNTIKIWELDWEYEFPNEVDWHEDAEPYVRNFLTLYNNQWTNEQFEQFYQKLQWAGLGWVRKEGVLRKMNEMAREAEMRYEG